MLDSTVFGVFLWKNLDMHGNLIDLTGKIFRHWRVIDRSENRKGIAYWNCACKCGTKRVVSGGNLKKGRSESCGCLRSDVSSLVGETFGRLTVLSRAENKGKLVCWNCLCICGNRTVVVRGSLKNGSTTSCGCYNREIITKHGMSRTTEYTTYVAMKKRCNNPIVDNYHLYGGRGIKVCESWLESFENFYEDMGEKPKNHSIERIDVNGNYCPENCKWSTYLEQSCNRRNNLETIGVQIKPSGKYQWRTIKKGKSYSGTCKTEIEAATAYDDKCEELHNYRPNGTTRK